MNNVSSSNSQKGLVPELRFPEFRDEWKKEKLSDFVVRVTRKNKDNQSNLPLTISSKDGLVDQVTYFNKKVSSKDMSGYYLLKNGEFAYNKSYSVGYDFGSIKRLDMYGEGALSTLYICFALKKHNSDFIKTYFDSLKWYKEIYMIAAEGARNHGLLNVPTEDFFDTVHALPKSIDEQTKIADFLTLLEQRILKQEKLVNALKLYKRGVLSSLFEQKVSFVKNSNWTTKSLGDIFTERTERATGNEQLLSVTTNEGIQKREELDSKDNSSENKSNYKKVYADDIAYNTMRMWQGASGHSPFNGIVSPAYTVIKLNDKHNHSIKFWSFYFKHIPLIKTFQKLSQGLTSDTWNLKYPQFAQIQASYPSYDEQQKIVSILETIDTKILAEEKLLENLVLYKKQLLQKMFI